MRRSRERSSHPSSERLENGLKSAVCTIIMSEKQPEGSFPTSSIFKGCGYLGSTALAMGTVQDLDDHGYPHSRL